MIEPLVCVSPQKLPFRIIKTILLSLPMMIIMAVMLTEGEIPTTITQQLALGFTYFFINALFFLMIYTGKTYQYRSLFFIVASVCFVLAFITNLIEVRGTMALSTANMLDGGAPFCPLVIPVILIPAVVTQTIIFPGSMFASHGIAPMLILWLGTKAAIMQMRYIPAI